MCLGLLQERWKCAWVGKAGQESQNPFFALARELTIILPKKAACYSHGAVQSLDPPDELMRRIKFEYETRLRTQRAEGETSHPPPPSIGKAW